jgi:hypothetical protein
MALQLSPEFERHMDEMIDAQAEIISEMIVNIIKAREQQAQGLQIAVSN